jgi:hypothetical protein
MDATLPHGEAVLGHERMRVYRAAVEFHNQILAGAGCNDATTTARVRELEDVLCAHAAAAVLEIAGGACEPETASKAFRYRQALMHATSCAAVLDLLGHPPAAEHGPARATLREVLTLLGRLLNGNGARPA